MHPFLIGARTGIFAEGRFFGRLLDEWINDIQEFVRTKVPHLIILAFIAFIFSYLLRIVTGHVVRLAERHAAGSVRVAQVKTLAGVIRNTGVAVIAAIVGMQALDAVGVNLSPLLASASVLGVAIGLAAQTIIKDVLNGVIILVEDQFNVGDTVKLAGLAGVVEGMTLRKTLVRDGDGTLYVIPNSQITTVANQSVGFSAATVNVSVDFSANPDKVTELLKKVAMEIRNDPAYRSAFLDDPQVLGVDAVKGSELVFPVVFKTRAMQQYGPIREFRRRVRLALEENHMLPGDPNRIFRAFGEAAGQEDAGKTRPPAEEHAGPDPTTLKPHETNPFVGE